MILIPTLSIEKGQDIILTGQKNDFVAILYLIFGFHCFIVANTKIFILFLKGGGDE